MPMSLTSLSGDLLSCVVANLALQSRHTLCSLARCSRQLYLCTTPHLYRHLTIQEETERRTGQLIKLASLLIRRPDLARLVQHFVLDSAGIAYSKPRNPRLAKFAQAFGKVTNASTLSETERILYLDQFRPSHCCAYDLILTSLLPHLIRVEKLVLNWTDLFDTHHLQGMLRKAARREKPFNVRPAFEALTVFDHSPSTNTACSTDFMALKLSAVRKISGSFESIWGDDDIRELHSSSSPLKDLTLNAHRLSAADLGHILRVPKALKTLSYMVFPPASISFIDMRHSLTSQVDSLESIEIDCDLDCDRNSQLFGPMPSFTSFTAIKVFQIAALFFLTTDLKIERRGLTKFIPPNLETLHLTRFHSSFQSLLEALEHLLAEKSSQQTPSLRTLILNEEMAFHPIADPGLVAQPAKLMDVLWKDTKENAIMRLRRVAVAQKVSICVIEDP